ncbi:hypothetical protein D3C87_1899280 [compost metagenome]
MRPAHGVVDVEQRHLLQVAGNGPAAAVAFFRAHIARLAQARHRAAHHHGVGAQHGGDLLGSEGRIVPGHVQQHVEHAGKAAVTAHEGQVLLWS